MRRLLLALALWVAAWGAPLPGQTPQPSGEGLSAALFDSSELHDVWVHINARDWDQLRARYLDNTFYPCDFEWRDLKVYNAGCRSRGTGSRNPVKPGLLVDFDYYVTGQQALGLTSLVLDNLWQDPSMLKERLSMLLFTHVGIAAPREAHARLHVGSRREFAGVYAIVEDVNQDFIDSRFGNGGGTLYEYRWIDAYRFEDLGSDLDAYAARFEPRNHRDDSPFALYAPLREMIRAINDASVPDMEATLAPYLDMTALLTHVAVENYLADWDGVVGYAGLNNFYLYRPLAGPARFIPWDKDSTFFSVTMPPAHNLDTNVLTAKAWAEPGLRAQYLRALLTAASAGDWLDAEAERQHGEIRDAALMDPFKPVSNEEFEQAVADIRNFLRTRGATVRFAVEDALSSQGTP